MRSGHMSHRRSVSVPNFEMSHWVPPPAPALQSPAMFESQQWMYTAWSSAPAIPIPETEVTTPTRAFPSVLEHTPTHEGYLMQSHYTSTTPSDSRSSSTESDPPIATSWSGPSVHANHLRPPIPLTPITTQTYQRTPSFHPPSHQTPPITPASAYHTPYPTPPLFHASQASNVYLSSPLAHSTSPTLAPEMSLPNKDLVGLGIGTHDVVYHTPTFLSEEYFASPHF